MLSRCLALMALCCLTACTRNIQRSPLNTLFSSSNDAVVRDCPLPSIDSLAPCRVHVARGEQELQRIAATEAKLLAHGDTLTFAVPASGLMNARISGGIELPLTRLPNSDLFAASVHVPRLSEAVISYRVFTDITRSVPVRFEFRGDKAPPRPPRARHLTGRLRFDTLTIPELNERREVISYLPATATEPARYPVVYLPDGVLVKQLAPILDTLIAVHELKPVVLVGVRAAADGARAREYVLSFDEDSARFRAHERFFVHDVAQWAEKQLPVANTRAGRILWGASNGGALVIAMGLRHPERYARVFASSPVFEKVPVPQRGVSLPVFHVAAGIFEGTSRDRAFGLVQVLKDLKAESEFHELVGGHDELVWIEWLVKELIGLNSDV